jgi:hypothetical protein
LRFQRSGAHQDVESRFDADAGHSFCQLHIRYTFQNSPSLAESTSGRVWVLNTERFQFLSEV